MLLTVLRVDYRAAAGSDLQRLQQELANARREVDIEKDLTTHHMQEVS